ncbi:MAG: sigma-70 family RNA polymerase sigma factor [Myxococcaceae bacterium]|nr:sigma-70 family RNA polymerase sigma factor [Myxococcaceae bacterium]
MARPNKETLAALERARAAWPGLALDESEFLAWLELRTAGAKEINVEDLWLVRACELNLPKALSLFERQALKPALAGLPERIRADVGQRVLQRLFTGADPKIRQYRGRGRLARWLHVVALRESRTERQQAERETVPDDLSRLAGAISASGTSGLERALHKQAQGVLARALEALGPDERSLLARHFLGGETHQALANELGIPRSTVAYRLTRLTQRVLESTRSGLRELGLTPSQLESLLGAMRSQVELTFSILRGS